MLTHKQVTMTKRDPMELVYEGALRIKHDPAFAPFLDYLKVKRETARDLCETRTGEDAVRAQGRALELKDVLNLIEQAPNLLEKVRAQR